MRHTSLALKGLTLRRLSDGDVFERAIAGDAAAFSEFYRRFRTAVYGYCLARLMSAADAEDATHETFLRVLDARPGSVSSPRAWLFGVAKNVCVDTIRARTRVEPTDLDEETGPGLLSASTDRVVEDRDDARAALLALRRMRPRYRTALIMREVIGESNEHLAESLGISVATAHTLVSRARDSFGREFAAVRDLPPACRDAVKLLYKRVGTGLTAEEDGRLEAHLASCAGCAIEARRIRPDRKLPAFVPLATLGSFSRLGLLGQATQVAAGTGAVAGAGVTTSAAIKLAIVAAVATAVAVPVAVQQASEPPIPTQTRATVAEPAWTRTAAGDTTAERERVQSQGTDTVRESVTTSMTAGDAGPHGAVGGAGSGTAMDAGSGSGGTTTGGTAATAAGGGSGGAPSGQGQGGTSGGSTSGGTTAGSGTSGGTQGGTQGGTSGGTQGGTGTGTGTSQDPGTGGTGTGSGAGAPGGATDTGGSTTGSGGTHQGGTGGGS